MSGAIKYKQFPREQQEFIRREVAKGRTDSQIAHRIGASLYSVQSFRLSIGLSRRSGDVRMWSQDEIDALTKYAGEKMSVAEIARKLGRTMRAVIGIAHRKKIDLVRRPAPITSSPQDNEPSIAAPLADFGSLIGKRRYQDDPRSLKPQPVVIVHRPPTHVMQVGQLG